MTPRWPLPWGVSRAYPVTPSSQRAQDQQLRFVAAAARVGVEHLVVLSQLGARTDSPVRFLRHHAVVEEQVSKTGLGYTFLWPNLFFQALLAFAPTIYAHGSMAAPIGAAGVSAVDVRDIGAVGATVLAHPQMAAALEEALGRQVGFTEVSGADFTTALAGVLPPWQLQGLVEDCAHHGRGEAGEVTSVVAEVTGARARSFADFAREHADAFR